MTSITNIRAGFTHKELPLIGTVNAHPTKASVRRWQKVLNACAATSPSTLAGGIYGHSFLTMKLSLFHTLFVSALLTLQTNHPLTPTLQ